MAGLSWTKMISSMNQAATHIEGVQMYTEKYVTLASITIKANRKSRNFVLLKKGHFQPTSAAPSYQILKWHHCDICSCLTWCRLLQSLTQDLRISVRTPSSVIRNFSLSVIQHPKVFSRGWNLLLLQQVISLQVIVERLLGIKGSYFKEIFILSSLCPLILQQQAWSKPFTQICQAYPQECPTASTGPSVQYEPRSVSIGTKILYDRTMHVITEFKTTVWVTTSRTRIWKR